MALDFQKINEAAENYRADMAAFLRAMISHPSESCEEKEVVACIKAEMEKLNFDKVEVERIRKRYRMDGRWRKDYRNRLSH